jgi:hypothetical protein
MQISLENNKVFLSINLSGGAFIDFHIKDQLLNPINYKDSENPPFKGHFICFDRWGLPTDSERENGFTPHGEANAQEWELLDCHRENNKNTELSMSCTLSMGGLQLTRQVKLLGQRPVFKVTEEIRNLNKYGRMFNIVQHVTIAPPFLDNTTLIDNNTEKGFEDKLDGSLNQEEPVITWPEASHNGDRVSLRQIQDEWPLVSSFVFNQNHKYGWVTACNPKLKLLLGYVWEIEDYPWINFWRSVKNKIPVAFGMEFGTTGLHESYPILAKKGKIFDRNIYDFIDANEIKSKSYTAFISEIPNDYRGVGDVTLEEFSIVINEINGDRRDIIL